MHYVYILKTMTGVDRLYVGSTDNLIRRLKEHNSGRVPSTKPYVPWQLIYYEAYISKTLARHTEIFYKSSQGRRQIRKKLGEN